MIPNPNLPKKLKNNEPAKLSWFAKDFLSPQSQHKALWGVVLSSTGHPELVDWAANLIRKNNISGRDELALSKAVLEYAQNEIKFFREDPERFASPLRTIKWGIGDCDDKSILIASILRSFRIPARLKIIEFEHFSKKDKKIKRFKHVYPQVKINSKIYAMESVHKWPMGTDAEDLLKRKGIIVESQCIGDF